MYFKLLSTLRSRSYLQRLPYSRMDIEIPLFEPASRQSPPWYFIEPVKLTCIVILLIIGTTQAAFSLLILLMPKEDGT